MRQKGTKGRRKNETFRQFPFVTLVMKKKEIKEMEQEKFRSSGAAFMSRGRGVVDNMVCNRMKIRALSFSFFVMDLMRHIKYSFCSFEEYPDRIWRC